MTKALPLLYLLLLIFTGQITLAQDPSDHDIDIQKVIEDIFAVQDNDFSYEELYESLLLYYANPLNLNSADRDEFRSLFILSESQISSILNYREKYGDFLSIYELQAVPEITLEDIYKILPFVKVSTEGFNDDPRPLLKRILSEPNNYLLLRYQRTLEAKKGYLSSDGQSSGQYAGSQDKVYARFRISHNHDFSLGFTGEKDAGEPWGFDFYSFHFQLQNKGKLKNIIVGDYQLQFGQGLLLASGFNIGKGAETITTVRRPNLGARPYSSVVETGYLRGTSVTYSLNKKLELTSFFSRLGQDALLRSDSIRNIYEYISSIQSSGFHRTQNEISSKNQIIEQTYGGNLLYHDNNDNLQLGLTFIGNHFSKPILKSNEPYNLFEFSGDNNYIVGISYQYNWQNFSFFGEAARSQSGGIGAVAGLIISMTSHLETSIVLRNYDRNFHSFYGAAFGESAGKNINEHGWYWGLKYTPSRKYELTAYFDQFNFPWLSSRISAPSTGYEYLFRFNYKPKREMLFYAQYRQESKAENVTADENNKQLKLPLTGLKNNITFNATIGTKNLSFKSRIQFSDFQFNHKYSSGYAIIQDIIIHLSKLSISTRFALFDTEDYENRQYAYERDVLYSFSIPAYYGKGSRQYILVKYKFSRKLDFWLKYARTHYRDQNTISSGSEQIKGNIKTDIKVQARIRF